MVFFCCFQVPLYLLRCNCQKEIKRNSLSLVLFVTVLILTMATIEIFKPHSKLCENGLYHGCYGVYKDGTRKLITGNCSRCKYRTNDPFG